MSLNASLNKFRNELSDTAARNAQYARPSSTAPARTTTPKPTDSKRSHDTAFSASQPASSTTAVGHAGSELLTQVWNAVKYLKEKETKPVPFDALIGYLSLPNDAQRNIPLIKRALQQNDRVTYLSKAESGIGKEAFKYRPLHPVTNGEELKEYLARQTTAQGIPVKDLRDGWPECLPTLSRLESEGYVLITRNKKDNTPRSVFPDSPNYHILHPATNLPQKVDADFVDQWAKTRLPASEAEIRTELEKAGLVPTSQVKEVVNRGGGRKEKRRVVRKGGKTTNQHMLGILKDYAKR